MDILKESMIKYSGGYDESMYTPQGGRSRLGMANEYGLDPESMVIDTLSFIDPANYTFNISGKNVETGGKVDGTVRQYGALPLKMDVTKAMGEHYKDDPFAELDAVISLKKLLENVGKEPIKKTNEDSLMRSKMMKALGIESDEEYDAFLKFKQRMENR